MICISTTHTVGAYTGAVSTCMLKDVGAMYVLCGHSERRTIFQVCVRVCVCEYVYGCVGVSEWVGGCAYVFE